MLCKCGKLFSHNYKEYSCSELKVRIPLILLPPFICDPLLEFTYPSLYRNEIQSIWENKSIQETYQRRNEFTLPDCCKYFLSQIARVSDPHFLPDVNDILQVRVKTTGIVEYKFQDEGKEIIMVLNRSKYLDSYS